MQDKYMGYSGDSQAWYRTSSSISSNDTNYMVGRTQDNTHWPSAMSLNIGPTGQFASNIGPSGNSSYCHPYAMRFMTTQVLPEGVRPRMFLANHNSYIYRSYKPSQSSQGIGLDRVNWHDADMVAAFPDISNRRSGYDTTYGMSGYNEKTGYYVLFGKTSNRNVDMFKWKIPDTHRLTDPKVNLKEAFLNATEFEYRQMDNADNLTSTEGYYRGVITVGDNGYCRWTRFNQNDCTRTYLFHLDSSVASQFIQNSANDSNGENYGAQSTSYQYNIGNTTSYGIDQGQYHIGVVYNSTWDNKWHIHFSHYYYYGAGMSAYVFSTADPRVCYRIANSNSSYVCSPIAWGRTGWILSRDQNSDGSDHYYHNINMQGMETTHEKIQENVAAGVSNPYGQAYTYSEWAPTSYFENISNTDRSGLVPAHGYHSTNYPRLLNVNWWPTKEGHMQFPGDY
tara:strand:+ start:2033 stop:3385 length:1353 start_codon:yes stop_codon:yes gene_type:complete